MDIDSFLIDIDGVLRVGETPVDGAIEILDFMKNSFRVLLVTNTTRYSLSELAKNLKDIGFGVSEKDIMTAGSATIDYIKSINKNAKCFVIAEGGLAGDFMKAGLSVVGEREAADFVVVGHDTKAAYGLLNAAFKHIMGGAAFIAPHKMKLHKTEDGLHLSSGIFVEGLEYCTGKKAVVIGKPNPEFFRLAIGRIGTREGRTAMVGDDIFADIKAAQDMGLKTVFVETGGFKREDLAKNNIKPDFVLKSIADIRKVLS